MMVYLLFWFPMLLIAIVNGILRETVIKRYVSELKAHQLSTVSLLLLFSLYIGWVVYRFPPDSSGGAVLVGVLWLVLTLCFEFGFGRYRGLSWNQLLAEYNMSKGKLWMLIPVWVLTAPYLFFVWLK